MESKALNIILGLFGVLSFIWSYFSKENRIIGIIVGFTIFILIFLSEQNQRIEDLTSQQKKSEEKLKIHEQLIDIKKDIELIKEKLKNEKSK